MYCNQCGKEIANETEFCTYCGASVGKVCTECGSPIFEGSHFCVKCGKGINASCPKCGKQNPAYSVNEENLSSGTNDFLAENLGLVFNIID